MLKRIAIMCLFFLLIFPLNSFSKFVIGVSIPPQKFFLEKIGGKRVHVVVLLPPGANPTVYEPKPYQLKMLSKARLFFSMGVPFEVPWLKRLKREFPSILIVPIYELIKRKPMKTNYGIWDKKVVSGFPDPHVWLSPPLVRVMGITILNTLKKLDPEGSCFYIRNYQKFVEEVDQLDSQLTHLFLESKNRSFLVFHPSWGYFAETYGLKQIPLEMEGKSPSIKEMGFFVDFAKKKGLKTIFVQPQFSIRFAKTLAKLINGKIEFLDPLAESWRNNIFKSAVLIKRSLDGR